METCVNTLYVRGDSDAVSTFFDFINETSDLGEYFKSLEKSVEDIEEDLDLPCASQSPWTNTFSVDADERTISWEARGYPSLLAVYKLSKDFPDINFVLDFDNTEDSVAGCIFICDGDISKKHLVYFDDGAIDLLLGNYGKEILSLKVGEKIEVGIGMVEVECTDEEIDDDNKDEVTKSFNVRFQCDESPKIIVHVTREDSDNESSEIDFLTDDWGIDDVEYSDDDGNEDTTEGSYNGEMCVHAEKPWIDDFLAYAEQYVPINKTRKAVKKVAKKPKDTSKNKEAALKKVLLNASALKNMSELRADKEFVLEAVSKDFGRALQYASEELRADKEVVLVVVKQNGLALQHASPALSADKEIVLEALKQNGRALEFASNELRADKEVVLAALKQDKFGKALEFASDELRADKEVVLTAVQQYNLGMPFKFASDELKADKEVVLAAIKQWDYRLGEGSPLKIASKELMEDKEFVLEVVKQNGESLEFASKKLKADKEVVLVAVTNRSSALQYASKELKADKDFAQFH